MRHDLTMRKKNGISPRTVKIAIPIRCVTIEFKCMIFTALYLALDASWNYEQNRPTKKTCKASVLFFGYFNSRVSKKMPIWLLLFRLECMKNWENVAFLVELT